ncbi:MAG: carbamoyltransferase HypF, partial [Candidatus Bathyarchaeota archaeon]
VTRFHDKNRSIIRRSRGYAPEPIHLKTVVNRCVLGVGAELNVTSCLLLRNKAFVSQHVGNVENLETLIFLKDSIEHLTKLTNSKIDIIACDLHPKFTTTKLAQDLENKLECPVIAVQHHHAHLASLMGEWNINKMLGIACDGFGYGLDGTAWGGEILYCNHESFQRVGHLEEQPMVGGDLATLYPLRMAAGILHGETDVEKWLLSNSDHFPHGRKEVGVIVKQLENRIVPKTTSCGRVLDAVSAILNICHERTYEGELAMKLESAALGGKDVLNLEPQLRKNVIDTTLLVHEIFGQKRSHSVADLAYSAQSYLAKSLAKLAVEKAELLNVDHIGFSGGVSYNEHITVTIKRIVEGRGFKFLIHNRVPPGDGGISFGQAIIAGLHKQ